MTEQGTLEEISNHVRALTEAKPDKRPAKIRANLSTIGRLLAAEAVHEQEHGGPKLLHGVPLVMLADLPDGEIQVLDDEGEVVRTLRVAG